MPKPFSSLFKVHVDFGRSHLLFPKIVTVILLLLLLAIFLVYGISYLRDVRRGKRTLFVSTKQFDKLRFFGTIVLTIAYFLSMDYVGNFFPNTGYGFLFMSMLFIFLLSLLCVHGLDRRKFLALSLNALTAPTVAWFLLARLFNISLP
jgi:putative tricarboxylic transport membrane protein